MRVFTTSVWRSAALGLLLAMAGAGHARADEALRHVQQSLRDQGFYYGPIDGAPGDETTQALRRYQIRNGLAVTGQLNDETRRSIERTGGSNSAGSSGSNRSMIPGDDQGTPAPLSTPTPTPTRRTPQTYHPPATPAPSYRPPTVRSQPEPDGPDDAEPTQRGPGNIRPDLRADPVAPPAAGGGYNVLPRDGIPPSAALSAFFASTPYEFAPPPVQADVLRRAQFFLARGGFYDGRVDGVPGPAIAEALTNFQEVNRLRRTGRLDVSTLGTLRLLPGRQTVGPRGDPRRGPDIIFQGRVVD